MSGDPSPSQKPTPRRTRTKAGRPSEDVPATPDITPEIPSEMPPETRLEDLPEDMTDIMPDEAAEAETPAKVYRWPHLTPKGILIGLGTLVAVLIAAVLLAIAGLDTTPGRRMLVDLISAQRFDDGLRIKIKRIDGSLYGRMRVHGLTLSDPKGVFLNIPDATLDWRPFDYLRGKVTVKLLSAREITFSRLPELKQKPPEPPKGSLLPDLDIAIDRISLARVIIGPAIMGPALEGKAGEMSLEAAAHLRDKAVRLDGNLKSVQGDSASWGLFARPDANRLDVSLSVDAPRTGVIVALAGLPDGLSARLQGKGDWKRWQGMLMADGVTLPKGRAGKALARLNIAAENGKFHIYGPLTPHDFAPEAARPLLLPALETDVRLEMKDRVADIDARLSSPAARLEADGAFDAARNRFRAMSLSLSLLRPEAVTRELKGRDLKLDLFLDGAFDDLKADFELKAASAGWDTILVNAPHAKGSARYNDKRLTALVDFGIGAISGVPEDAATLLKASSGRGDISLDEEKLSLKSLRLDSAAIRARGEYGLDFKTENHKGQIDAELKGYDVQAVGRVAGKIKGQFSLSTLKGSKTTPRLEADADLKTLSLVDDIKSQLGGNATLKSRITTGLNGDIRFNSLNASAPKLKLTATGVWRKNGTLSAEGRGESVLYGPLAFAASGPVSKPVIILDAARPGFGVGLKDLKARAGLDLDASSLDVTATAGSDYGPVVTEAGLSFKGPVSVNLRRAEAAGVGLSGQLTQSPEGPFAGTLALTQGLSGQIRLRAAGKQQAADFDISAREARLANNSLYIGRLIATGRATLAERPLVTADVQMSETRYATLRLRRARAKVDLKGDTGTVQFVGSGEETGSRRGGQSVYMALNGALNGPQWRVNANARVNDVPLRLAAPAVLRDEGTQWRLETTTLVTDQGRLSLGGTFGDRTRLEMWLKDFDLGLINAIIPTMGISGLTNGTMTYASGPDGHPSGHMRLNVERFSHAGLDSVSSQVSMAIEADLAEGARRGTFSSVIRQNDAVIGRIQATVAPSGQTRGLDALLEGNISGGIRYNGPSGPLFSLTGLTGQSLSGPISLGADISGSLKAPQLNGLVRADNLTYDNEAFGTRLSQVKLEGRFSNDRLDLTRFDGRVGDGNVAVSGWVSLAADKGFPMALKAEVNNARLARSDALSSTVTGTLNITRSNPEDGLIEGELNLPQTRYEITPPKLASVPELEGVRRAGDAVASNAPAPSSLPLFALNVRIRADNQVFLNGMGLQSEWQARLALVGTTRAPRLTGQMRTLRGTYDFAGKSFTIDDGVIDFTNGDLLNPSVTLNASTTVKDLTGKIAVTGFAQKPAIAFSSNPSLPEDEVLSRVLFGQSLSELSATEAVQLASAINGLRGSGLTAGTRLRAMAGIDRLRVVGADESTGRGTSLAAGKYLTGNIYVEVVTDAKGFITTQFDIALSRALSLLSQTGSANETSVRLRYSKDY